MNTRALFAVVTLGACTTVVACSVVLGIDPVAVDPSWNGSGSATPDAAEGSDAGHEDGGVPSDAAPSDAAPKDAAPPCTIPTDSDPKNCGRCGHDCAGGSCKEGICQALRLAGGLAIPEGLAVDSTSVFVAEYDTNRIVRFDKGTVSVCATAPLPYQCVFEDDQSYVFKPTAMATDGTNVYWANGGSGSTHAIRSCPRTGCGTSDALVVATLQTNALRHVDFSELLPLELVVKNGRVFWPENTTGAIRSAPVDGGAQTTYLENLMFAPAAIAVDDVNVYFTDDSTEHTARVRAVPLDGTARDGGGAVLATPPARPLGIALTKSGTLYWSVPRVSVPGDGLVQSAPKSGLPGGGAPTSSLATSQVAPTSVLVDDANVYWVQAGSANVATGMVVYCPLSGCPTEGPIVLATGQNQPRHLAQDEAAIYWSNEGLSSAVNYDGEVWKVAKP